MRIVVTTCDKNTFVIPIFWHFAEKYWSDCCWPIDILGGPRLLELLKDWKTPCRKIAMSDDSCWSDMLLSYLDNCCDSELLLILLEDYIIMGPVDTKRVKICLNVIKADPSVQFMRLTATPGPTLEWVPLLNIGEFDKEMLEKLSYLSSLMPTIWRVEHLRRLLRRGETAWDVEIAGSERARHLPGIYLGSRETLIGVHNYLKRGKINPAAVEEVAEKW